MSRNRDEFGCPSSLRGPGLHLPHLTGRRAVSGLQAGCNKGTGSLDAHVVVGRPCGSVTRLHRTERLPGDGSGPSVSVIIAH